MYTPVGVKELDWLYISASFKHALPTWEVNLWDNTDKCVNKNLNKRGYSHMELCEQTLTQTW